jgi:hypothetical protein
MQLNLESVDLFIAHLNLNLYHYPYTPVTEQVV